MIWSKKAKNLILSLAGAGLLIVILLLATGCTAAPGPDEPTPTPTSEMSPISPIPMPTLGPLATPTPTPLPYKDIYIPPPTFRPGLPEISIQAADIVTFSMDLLCDAGVEFDPEEMPPDEFMATLSYTLYAMSRIKVDGEVVAESVFNTGIGPYLGDGPCTGKFATLHFHVDRMLYEWPLIPTFWGYGCWYPPAGYDLPIVCFEPGPDEIVDGDGFSFMGNFRGMLGAPGITIYLPIMSKSSVSNEE